MLTIKNHLLAAIALLVFAASASAITIDFEEQSIASGGGGALATDGPDLGVSQGFRFTLSGTQGGWVPGDIDPVNIAATGNSSDIALDWCTHCGLMLTMEHDGGSAFNLQGFDFIAGDFLPLVPQQNPFMVTGYYAGGGSVSVTLPGDNAFPEWNSASLGIDWSNLERIEFLSNPPGTAIGSIAAIDNIQVSVVPIPAALPLLMSALGLLGWMRRGG